MYTPEGGIYSGNVLLDVYDSISGALTGERDVGNTQNLTFDPTNFEKKERIGKRMENYGQTIDSVLLKQTQAFKFTLDDINKENLALQMFGADSVVNVSASSKSAEEITAHLNKWVKLEMRKLKSSPAVVVKAETPDAWAADTAYELGDFVLAGSYRAECTVAGDSHGTTEPTWPTTVGETIADNEVTWTIRKLTYTLDTDYEVDYNAGMIKALSTGAIAEDQTLKVDYSYNAYTGYKVLANQVTAIHARVRLVGKNVVNNDDVEVLVHKASLIPTGGINWITEEYATLEFTGDIIAVDAGTWEVTVLDA